MTSAAKAIFLFAMAAAIFEGSTKPENSEFHARLKDRYSSVDSLILSATHKDL